MKPTATPIFRSTALAIILVMAGCATAEPQSAPTPAPPAPTVNQTPAGAPLARGLPQDAIFAECPQGFGDQPANCQ